MARGIVQTMTPIGSGARGDTTAIHPGVSFSIIGKSLVIAVGIGNDHPGPYTPAGTTGLDFAAFTVRSEQNEDWRI